MTNTPILRCRDLSVSYFSRAGEIPAVIDFNLDVMPGEAVGIVGESGCGKSTVALAIMQYLGKNGAIRGGQVLFMGRDMRQMTPQELRAIRGAKIAMIYQEPMASLNPAMTIGMQLMEVPIFHDNLQKSAAYDRVIDMLEAVKLPDPQRMMKSYPHQLSGGQQQRVVIAMALLSNPKLIILDEPTTALDVTVEAGIVVLIKEIAARFGTALIYISHNLGLILETCDRLTVMYSGEAVEVGTISEVFDQMRHPYTRGLFSSIPLPNRNRYHHPLLPIRGQLPLPHKRPKGCNFGPRCDYFTAGTCDAKPIAMADVVTSPTHQVRCNLWQDIDWGKQHKASIHHAPLEAGPIILSVDGMKKYYKINNNSLTALVTGNRTSEIKANEKIDLKVRAGETLAIVGESGCGKSTLAKVLMGLETATAGSIKLDGEEISQTTIQNRNQAQIASLQMVFQNPFDTLNPSYIVGAQIARVIRKFGQEKDKSKISKRVDELLDLVKLPRDFARRKPRQLSGGQKQRIGIARAFAGHPKIVVADEPVSALDVSVQAAVTELLTDIQRDHHTTMVFISHDLSVVRYLADRMVVMYLGRIMEQGRVSQVYAPPYHPYTEALLAAIPIADPSIKKKTIILEGEIPSAISPPSGCPFHTRCPYKIPDLCEKERPEFKDFADGHRIACHLSDQALHEMEPVIQSNKVT